MRRTAGLCLPVLLLLMLGLGCVDAAEIRFVARPYDVTENEAVVFTYLEEASSVKFADIRSWKWDFDGDSSGTSGWEVQKTVNGTSVKAQDITTTWSAAVFNAAKGDPAVSTPTARFYKPKLQITYGPTSGPTTETITGVTEPLQVGLAVSTSDPPYPYLIVRKQGSETDEIAVSMSANPRLARATGTPSAPATQKVKLYAEVSFKAGVTGDVTNYEWNLDWTGLDSADPSVPGFPFGITSAAGAAKNSVAVSIGDLIPGDDYAYAKPGAGQRNRRSVALKVHYTITTTDDNGNPVPTNYTRTILQRDFVVIEHSPVSLSMGRAYRQGFPERYGWDDIVLSYKAADSSGETYVYFKHLEDAFFQQQQVLAGSLSGTALASARQLMAETVNELLQGQTMRGAQAMIDALRLRYPRITTQPTERMPTPAGAREETAALETAALDFQQPLQYAAFAIRAYGADVLRAWPDKGPDGTKPPPNPNFPNYLTYYDSTLTGQDVPIPVKNEYWQMATCAGDLAQTRTEKAKLLWRLSTQDSSALPEAKEECKVAATQAYLHMALLSTGQTADEFIQNEGNDAMASMKIATDLFDKINAGVTPLGTDGSYIPNESFAAIHQDATDAVTQARTAEVDARNEKRTYDRNQADLRNELLSQRNSYITPLKLLTGIDPATYNNLATVGDQKDFKNAFYSRLNNLLENYPNADPQGLGQYGNAVAAILDAGLAVQDQITALNNLYESIKISQWANAEIELISNTATKKLRANDIWRGYINAFSVSNSTTFHSKDGWSNSTTVTFNPGAIATGYLNAEDRDIINLQQARIADIQLEAEVRKSLLQAASLAIAIRRAGVALDQARLNLDSLNAQMERYIEDLAHTRNTAADLYFQDPSFRVFASQTERRAAAELDFSVDRLYRLAKTLQYEWTEPYQNPIETPAACNEPTALESALFDKFTRLDSLFAVRSADEAQDYLDALKAWDSKLRRINGVSVRGPNHSAPISAVPISMREHVLGYKPNTATGYTLEKSIADFRNYLESVRVDNVFNPSNPSLEIHFPIGIFDNTYVPATGSRWNMRLSSISADLYAESGFSDQQVAEIDLIQSGMVSLRKFWSDLPLGSDDFVNMTHYVDDYDRTVFATAFPARINGATGGRPLTEFDNAGLADRPVGTTEWILRINTENPANRNIDFTKLKDIVLRFTYTYGNAPEFVGF